MTVRAMSSRQAGSNERVTMFLPERDRILGVARAGQLAHAESRRTTASVEVVVRLIFFFGARAARLVF